MFKRVGFFILLNILVVLTVSIILNLLGFGETFGQGMSYTGLMVFCLVWGMVGSGISLLLSKWMAKRMMGLEVLSPTGPYGELVRKVHEIARRAKLQKMPEVAVYESPEVNAFATGPSRNNSLVAVSTGLLKNMDSEETEGVLAHEVAHIANGDMVTMALLQGVINAFVMFAARIVAGIIDNFLRGDEEGGGGLGFIAYFFVIHILQVLFGILAAPVLMGFSRWREYRADAGSASIVGKEKMIRALERLKAHVDQVQNKEPAFETMKINSKQGMVKLFASHPSLDDRIAALQKMR